MIIGSMMSSYPPLTAEINDNRMFITIDEKAKQENLTFNRHLSIPHIVIIEPVNNGHHSLHYSPFKGKLILTTYLGYDYDGKVIPKTDYRYKRELIKDIEIEHVSSLSELTERHIKRTREIDAVPDRYRRTIEEQAFHDFSRLIKALTRG